jgi:hypothetical protein
VKPWNIAEAAIGVLALSIAIHEYRTAGDLGIVGFVSLVLGGLFFLVGVFGMFGKVSWRKKLGAGSTNALAAVILIALLALGGYVVWKGYLSIEKPAETVAPPVTGGERISLDLPVRLIIYNEIAGTPFTPTSVEIYDTQGRKLETLTPSGGVAESSFPYRSGTQLLIKITDGSAFYFVPVIVPDYDKDEAQATQPTVHLIRLDAVDIPTSLSLKVYDNVGDAVGTTYNITAPTNFMISVVNNEADTSVHDPFNNVITSSQYIAGLVIKIEGSTANVPLITGATPVYTGQGIAVYYLPLDPEKVKAVTDPRTGTVQPGTEPFTINIDPTGLSGNSYTVTITAYADLDISYMQKAAGVVNSDAVSLGTVSFTLNVQ